jgi:small-conductance mechanosensitive channel
MAETNSTAAVENGSSSNAVTNVTTGSKQPPPDDKALQLDILDRSTLAGALFTAVVVAVCAWFAGRLVRLAVQRILTRPKHIPSDPTAIRFMGQLARAGVYVFALVTYARLIPGLDKFGTTLLASVGAASIVVGLAAQNTLGNLISGISLLLYRPFNAGDRIQVTAPTGLETGVVESLNLGYTVLRTIDDRHVVIPNSVMASQTSVNLSSSGSRILCTVPFTVGPDADLERVRKVLVEIAGQLAKPGDYVGSPVTALSSSSATLTLQIWCDGFKAAADLKSNLLEAARKRFKTEGIELR